MTELLTAAQMRAIEQAAIDSGQVTGLELMERAGRGAVDAILAEWPALAEGAHRAVVLCGPGNNGGDGFVVARLLKERGWEVEVFLYGDPAKLPPDARVNWERWGELGTLRILTEENLFRFDADIPADAAEGIVVDAVLGIGLKRPMDHGLARCLSIAHSAGCFSFLRSVALDIRSGLCSDSGKRPSDAKIYPNFHADLTLAFHRAKVGHYLDLGAETGGRLKIVDIGLDRQASLNEVMDMLGGLLGAGADIVRSAVLREWSGSEGSVSDDPVDLIGGPPEDLPKSSYEKAHKFAHGHALILSGGVGRGGAARMAARGALRIGAGLVTVACPPAAVIENAAQLNAIMLRPVKDADALREALEDGRINALCLGPGLGLGEHEAALVAAALEAGRPTVLDGDALTLIGRDPALFAALHDRCVLTPHMGEFARVFPDIAEKLNAPATEAPAYSKVDAARDAAKRAGCTVLLKGPDTVIADPDGRAAINSAHYERSVPWLATAGAGDVLAGFIAGLLARGFTPFDAACAAAWLHVECALEFGPGLIAEDLPEVLPRILARLEKGG